MTIIVSGVTGMVDFRCEWQNWSKYEMLFVATFTMERTIESESLVCIHHRNGREDALEF